MIDLFTDTSANLPPSLLRENNIRALSFSYSVNGEEADYSAEKEFDGKTFYDAMRGNADIKTSMVNVESFFAAFHDSLSRGRDVLYVGMSGGISGTAHSASLAIRALKEEFPEREIAAVDTYAASLGEGLMVLEAADLIKNGGTVKSIENNLLSKRGNMCQYFTVDDLSYLQKGGRLSRLGAIVGTILQIKPILTGDDEGKIVLNGKVRGRKQALAELAKKYESLVIDKTADTGIAHADALPDAEYLLELLREKGFRGKCLTVCYEPVTGSHVGPGAVALFFRGSRK